MEINKNKIVELCNQIKAKLQEQGKTYHVVNIASGNKDFTDVYNDIIDELQEKWSDYSLDCETRIVSYDCGDYYRSLQLYGVTIENDELLFYVTEVEESNNGCGEVDQDKLTLEELLNPRCWWMAGGNPEVPFRLDEVLEYYSIDLSE